MRLLNTVLNLVNVFILKISKTTRKNTSYISFYIVYFLNVMYVSIFNDGSMLKSNIIHREFLRSRPYRYGFLVPVGSRAWNSFPKVVSKFTAQWTQWAHGALCIPLRYFSPLDGRYTQYKGKASTCRGVCT